MEGRSDDTELLKRNWSNIWLGFGSQCFAIWPNFSQILVTLGVASW